MKKILAIVLVVAMLFTIVGCNNSTTEEPVVTETPAVATVAPVVTATPTTSPTETPVATETPSSSGGGSSSYVTLSPTVGTDSTVTKYYTPTVGETLTLADGADEYKITLSSSTTSSYRIETEEDATITISGDAGSADITIEADNAHIEYSATTTGDVVVGSSSTTFVMKSGSEAGAVTSNKGSLTVSAGAEVSGAVTVPETNTTATSVEIAGDVKGAVTVAAPAVETVTVSGETGAVTVEETAAAVKSVTVSGETGDVAVAAPAVETVTVSGTSTSVSTMSGDLTVTEAATVETVTIPENSTTTSVSIAGTVDEAEIASSAVETVTISSTSSEDKASTALTIAATADSTKVEVTGGSTEITNDSPTTQVTATAGETKVSSSSNVDTYLETTDGTYIVDKNSTESDKTEVAIPESKDLTTADIAFTDEVGVIVIPVGYTLTISEDFTLGTSYTIKNYGTIIVKENATFTNNGNVINNGTITAEAGATVTQNTDSTITNNGTIEVYDEDGLQAALEIGGKIEVTAVTYTENINIAKATTIIGTSGSKIVGNITIAGDIDVTIDGFEIDGSISMAVGSGDVNITNNTFVEETISNDVISYSNTNYVNNQPTGSLVISGNTFTAKADGSSINNAIWNITGEDVSITGNTFSGYKNKALQVLLYDSSDITVSGNTFNDLQVAVSVYQDGGTLVFNDSVDEVVMYSYGGTALGSGSGDKTTGETWVTIANAIDAKTIILSTVASNSAMIVPADSTLTIDEGQTLEIPENATLTNNGTITNNGKFTNNEVIYNNGTITGEGEVTGTGSIVNNGTYEVYDENALILALRSNTATGTVLMGSDIAITKDHDSITTFYGTFDGGNNKLSGTSNTDSGMIIYNAINATIQNITVDVSGTTTGMITMANWENSSNVTEYRYQGTFDAINITTTGIVDDFNATNYAPIILYSFAKETTFTNCTNDADITMTGALGYGSAFLGGYVYSVENYTATLTFDNCTNNGDLTMSDASVFVGNGSNMAYVDIELKNTNTNNGAVLGYISAEYFAAKIHTTNEEFTSLATSITKGANDSLSSPLDLSSVITVTDDSGIIKITETDPNEEYTYVIEYGAYTTMNEDTVGTTGTYYIGARFNYIEGTYSNAVTFTTTDPFEGVLPTEDKYVVAYTGNVNCYYGTNGSTNYLYADTANAIHPYTDASKTTSASVYVIAYDSTGAVAYIYTVK